MENNITNHLARRLPYGVKCQVTDQGKTVIAELSGVYSDGSCCFADLVESEKGFSEVKPILRNLDSLTKLITHKGKQILVAELLWGWSVKEEKDYILKGKIPEYWKMCLEQPRNDWDYKWIKVLLEFNFHVDEPEGTFIYAESLSVNPYEL